jgi:hypothetical protein
LKTEEETEEQRDQQKKARKETKRKNQKGRGKECLLSVNGEREGKKEKSSSLFVVRKQQ